MLIALIMLPFFLVPLPVQTTTRTVTVGDYKVRVSAARNTGKVEVLDKSGRRLQNLSCPLGYPGDSDDQLKYVGKTFVSSLAAGDLDFDGHPDLKAAREFGAKWQRYCVWMFQPELHMFSRDGLAEQMELLYNLTADPKKKQIIAYSIGPLDPLRDVYRIEESGPLRPYWRRLVPVESCWLGNEKTVVTRYDQPKTVSTSTQGQPPAGFDSCNHAK